MRRVAIRMACALALALAVAGAGGLHAQTCTTFDFQDGTAQGFTFEAVTGTQLWHLENNVCGAEATGHSTPYTMYYGQTFDICNYNAGTTAANLVSPAIPISDPQAQVSLNFNYLLDVETGTIYDLTFVDVSPDGVSWTQVADKNSFVLGQSWNAAPTLDLTSVLAGSGAAYVRFRFDSVDDIANGFIGWHVDDIVVCETPTTTVLEIPTASRTGLLLLALAVGAAAIVVLRRR